MNNYKIKCNNDILLKCLGNLFPFDFNVNKKLFSISYSNDFLVLLNQITDNKLEDLFTQYLSKSINKYISSIVSLTTTNYGLTNKFKLSTLVQSDEEYIVINNNIRVVINTDGIDFYIPKIKVYETLSSLTEKRFFNKWKKLFETFAFEYNPIKPYDMSIHDNNFDEHGGHTKINRKHFNRSESETENEVIDDTTTNGYKGFNSDSYSDVDRSKNTSNDTSKNTEKVDITGEVDTTHGRTVESDRNITRSGNIGNITQQELIERERKLWEYQLYDIIFRDLDSIYTRPKYIRGCF